MYSSLIRCVVITKHFLLTMEHTCTCLLNALSVHASCLQNLGGYSTSHTSCGLHSFWLTGLPHTYHVDCTPSGSQGYLTHIMWIALLLTHRVTSHISCGLHSFWLTGLPHTYHVDCTPSGSQGYLTHIMWIALLLAHILCTYAHTCVVM